MFSLLKSLSGIAVILIILLFYNSFSYAGEINPNPKLFDRCTRVTDNTYRCKLDKASDAAKIKGYSCQGDTCTFQFASPDKSKQEKGSTIYGFNNMPYTLCSKSECTIDKKRPNMAFCSCPIVNTKDDVSSMSLGPSDRKKSLPAYDSNGNMVKVTSNFSMINVFDFKNRSKIYDNITVCKYKQTHSFADCFGVICKVDKQNALNAHCYCPIQETESFVSIVDKCNTSPDKVYSAVSLPQFQLEGIYTLYKHFGWMQ